MKNFFLKTAYTLIELIISLVLVSVVVLGIFSINMVLNNNNQDYGQRYLVRSETQNTLNHILNNASLAVGSGTNVGNPSVLDQGIVFFTSAGVNQNFCIHQQNPGDIWACYEFDLTPVDPAYHQICYCNASYNLLDGSGYRGATAANCCGGTNSFLGTAYSVNSTFTNNVFSITIQNCLNNNNPPGTCGSDPVNNPQVTVSGSVFPPQEGNG